MTINIQEKRKYPRYELTTFCPVVFIANGEKMEALMVNASQGGAKIQFCEENCGTTLQPGDELDLEIHTHAGISRCLSKVCWVGHDQDFTTFGVVFQEIAKDPDDPLRVLLDSFF